MRAAAGAGIGRRRWVVAALLFSAMVFNYFDRQMLAILKPELAREFHWSETQYADIVVCFQGAYALGYVSFGPVVDRIGARLGLGLGFLVWSCAQIAHGLVSSVGGFALVRGALGFGEGGAYPSGLSAIARWFPARERALATGVFNAGVNIGAVVTPLVVPIMVLALGWRAAFVLTGLIGLIWLAGWFALYRAPENDRRLSAGERELIGAGRDPAPERIAWRSVIARKETWAYAGAKFLIDPVFWLFLFWLPDFLSKRHGLDLKSFGPPLAAIYLLSDGGSLAGGWASSALIKRGVSVNLARKAVMGACALLAAPVAFAPGLDSLWLAVAVIGLATAAHQAFSVNLFTLPSDLFPSGAVGSVVGFGGMLGALGGMAMARWAGWVLDRAGSYGPIFALVPFAYIGAIMLVHWLSPRLEPVRMQGAG